MLTWCIGNVVGTADRRRNLYPTKSRPDQKIDAAVALMMAMGHVMVEDEQAKGWTIFLHPIFVAFRSPRGLMISLRTPGTFIVSMSSSRT